MGRPIISVEGLGKEYVIGSHERAGESFREMLTSSLTAPFRRLRALSGGAPMDPEERFWALKDVTFHVEEGDVVGIIGRNGAGKSTLLKILSRIVEPTEGQVTLRGRVASLLEVGTGFHPELTGRENIFLNGAILGMSHNEIARKFDEIVAFAEVERFLDTPVKRYSSGMYVRLAFSVAAHLEPEILVVDEVLAVGDIAFQEKCLNKMESTAKGGRTVLFVSHNMHAVARLCNRCVALQGGLVSFDGEVDKCIESYIGAGHHVAEGNVIGLSRRPNDEFYVDRIEVLDGDRRPLSHVKTWDEVIFRIVFHSPRDFPAGSVEFLISTMSAVPVLRCSTRPDSMVLSPFKEGENVIECHFPRLALSAGRYLIGAGLAVPNVEWLYQNLDGGVLEIGARDIFSSGLPPHSSRYVVPMEHTWVVQNTESINASARPDFGVVAMTLATTVIDPTFRTNAAKDVSWPRITVITPSFNQASYLEQTILSVLEQGYPNLEYMIIDGGSTDGSVDLIRKYEKSLAYWVSEQDRGQTHAINKGVERATGDLIAYLNSDDYYLPGALKRVAQEYIARPEADLFYGRCRIVDETGAKTGQRTGDISSYEEVVDLWGVWWKRRNFVQPEVFWTKRIADLIGPFREELQFVMDYEYWTRIFRHGGRPAFIDSEFSCFRLHGQQKSTQAERSVAEQLRVLRPLLWDRAANISPLKRQLLKGLWLYDSVFLETVKTSVNRGDSRLQRLASLSFLVMKHPRLLIVREFRQRMFGALKHFDGAQSS